jgi:hypothetical protein
MIASASKRRGYDLDIPDKDRRPPTDRRVLETARPAFAGGGPGWIEAEPQLSPAWPMTDRRKQA